MTPTAYQMPPLATARPTGHPDIRVGVQVAHRVYGRGAVKLADAFYGQALVQFEIDPSGAWRRVRSQDLEVTP